MPKTKIKAARVKSKGGLARPHSHRSTLETGDIYEMIRRVRAGFSFKSLADFEKASGLSREKITRLVAIPQRTLTRRRNEGKLKPEESDRLLRICRIFDRAVELFEGDPRSAREWLEAPQTGLGGEVPLEFASTEVGAREVENLIGRLEHGVIA